VSGALEIAAVGMQAQQRALDTIANNISNINTPAFKRSELRFSELVGSGAGAGPVAQANAVQSDALAGVEWQTRPLVDRQGQLEVTGNPRDLAIDGVGFIELLGPAGRTLLWRGGTLKVLDDGALASSAGYALKAGINVPSEAAGLRIDGTGKVFATLPAPQGEMEIGQINLVKASDSAQLERLDGGIFAAGDEQSLTEAGPGEEGLGTLVQSSVEHSNVDLNTEMVSLLISQRAYAANAQVIRAADELYGIANGLRR
jgi:flagellar basal-body rod protein FlgG